MQKLLTDKNINDQILIAIGITMATVSIICEALFFIDFAIELEDKVLAGLIGAGLVGAQFSFVRKAVQVSNTKGAASAIPLWFATAILFLISVIGTATYFEGRFSLKNSKNIHESLEYQTQKRILDGYLSDKSTFTALYEKETLKGNDWMAGQHQLKAAEATKKAQEALNQLADISTPIKTASTALGGFAGEYRWGVWFAIACLVDLTPLLCFAYTTQGKTEQKIKNIATSKPKTSELKPALDKQQQTQEMTAVNNGLSETANKLFEVLKQADPENPPRYRDIKIGVGNPKLKAAFDELKQIGFVVWPEAAKTYQINPDWKPA